MLQQGNQCAAGEHVREVMTTIDRRLFDLDRMGIDIQVVAPAPGQCYYSIDPKIAEAAHRLANDGVVEYCSRKPDRFFRARRGYAAGAGNRGTRARLHHGELKLKGVEILTNVNGQELSDPKFRPFFAKAEQLGAFIIDAPERIHPWRTSDSFLFQQCSGKSARHERSRFTI